MVRAIAKSGAWAGQPLWRCSDFSCPTLINIDDEDLTPPAPFAGESAQARFEQERAAHTERLQRGAMLLAAVAVLVALVSFFLAAVFVDLQIAAVIALLIVLVFAWALFHVLPNDVIYWGKGAEAERRVGAKLDSLESLGFVTLYDRRIPGRGGNIDAVTVGPPGVFVVETKWRGRGVEVIQGRFEVGGREQSDALRQVTEQAMLVQVSVAQAMNRHRLTVVPVLCIGNRTVGGAERAGGILVLDVKSIASRLAAEPPVLDPLEVQELAGLLDRALPAYERRRG
jgi:Nuclease-related domain.